MAQPLTMTKSPLRHWRWIAPIVVFLIGVGLVAVAVLGTTPRPSFRSASESAGLLLGFGIAAGLAATAAVEFTQQCFRVRENFNRAFLQASLGEGATWEIATRLGRSAYRGTSGRTMSTATPFAADGGTLFAQLSALCDAALLDAGIAPLLVEALLLHEGMLPLSPGWTRREPATMDADRFWVPGYVWDSEELDGAPEDLLEKLRRNDERAARQALGAIWSPYGAPFAPEANAESKVPPEILADVRERVERALDSLQSSLVETWARTLRRNAIVACAVISAIPVLYTRPGPLAGIAAMLAGIVVGAPAAWLIRDIAKRLAGTP